MQRDQLDIYNILEDLNVRRALYLGNGYNFNCLDAFISGFTIAALDRQLESYDYPNFGYFNTWLVGHLKKHFGETGGWHWQLTNRNPNDESKAFDDFFYFLNIFKNSTVHSKFILLSKAAIEFSKSGPVRKFDLIDGKEIKSEQTAFKIVWTTIDNSTTVWLDYLDEAGSIIEKDVWSINRIEAINRLETEFGSLTNDWTANLA